MCVSVSDLHCEALNDEHWICAGRERMSREVIKDEGVGRVFLL